MLFESRKSVELDLEGLPLAPQILLRSTHGDLMPQVKNLRFLYWLSPLLFVLGFAFQNCSQTNNSGTKIIHDGNNSLQGTCPANFVEVPGDANLHVNNFCVAKYEAKNVSGFPESKADDVPWTTLTRDQAVAACASKGTGYALLDNAHWMALARNIESVDWNFGGDAGLSEYGISRGLTNNINTSGYPASNDDNDSCYLALQSSSGPPASCDLAHYDVARRVHRLSNGEKIWDLAGNVSEWISDDFTQNYGSADWIINIPAGTIKNLFGPYVNYPAGPAHPTGNIYMYNMGYLSGNVAPPYVVFRGGGWDYGRYSGIYTAYFVPTTHASADVGFRCYYQP